MYYNDYNWFDDQDNALALPARQTQGAGAAPSRKRGPAAGIVALCLVCALLGGVAGGLGVARFLTLPGNSTTIFESSRAPTVVNMVNVDGRTELTDAEIYATNLAAVVGVNGNVKTNYWGREVSNAVAGSGFVITADGYILTNYHVIDGVQDIRVSFADGTSYAAELIGGDEVSDIAVLKIEATGLTPVVVGDSDNLNVGEHVVAIGNPLGELTFTLTEGVLSAIGRDIRMRDGDMASGDMTNMLQTNAAINSGNSGGPLFNAYGELIGITTAKYSNNGDSTSAAIEGIGFAVPINDVKDMVADLISHGYVIGRPFLGISLNDAYTASDEPAGAYVVLVTPGYAADRAGIKEGDTIVAIEGRTVTTSSELITAMRDYTAGQTITLTVLSGGESRAVSVALDEKTAENLKAQNEHAKQRQLELDLAQQQQPQQQPQQQDDEVSSFIWPYQR